MKTAIASADRVRVEALRRVVAGDCGHELTWVAHDGAEAVERCAGARPDILLLDLDLPGLGCVEVTRQVMGASPCAILLVGRGRLDAARPGDVGSLFEAMALGALEVVPAPRIEADGSLAGGVAVAGRIRVLERLIDEPSRGTLPPVEVPAPPVEAGPSPAVLVAIGASSGGPTALQKLLRGLPRNVPAALLIVQDIEPAYVAGLASWLEQQTQFPVRLATPGASVVAGAALLAPLRHRIVLTPEHAVQLGAETSMGAEPSMDEFLGGLADHAPPGIAVLLSNQRRDGTEGLLRLLRAGWRTIRQATPGHGVSDSPGTDTWAHSAALVLPADAIAPTIVAWVARSRGAR